MRDEILFCLAEHLLLQLCFESLPFPSYCVHTKLRQEGFVFQDVNSRMYILQGLLCLVFAYSAAND